jgi:hypothetical protein
MKPASDEAPRALGPITSLISKSAKAQRKLTPGTWQHTMLRENLKALRLAVALIKGGVRAKDDRARKDVRAALAALASMISRTRKARAGQSPGTPQHTLLTNRLKSLRLARTLVAARLGKRNTEDGVSSWY